MNEATNRRGRHRRYADRRIAALLQLHEVLFYEAPGKERAANLMKIIQEDFETDRVALLIPAQQGEHMIVTHRSGDWGLLGEDGTLCGKGIDALLAVHRQSHGALTLSRFRQPSIFSPDAWDALWSTDLCLPASALLSVPVFPDAGNAPQAYLLLALNGTSREWSSHDRDLAEEVSTLLSVAMKQSML